jgi:predicted XRE-type DNA-binding protein
MKTEAIVESSGNVFADLGFSREEATLLAMRAELMAHLRETIARNGWTQAQAAQHLGVGQSRVSDLVRGKYDKFSLDMLVTLATRAGGTCLIRALDSGGDTAGFL